MELAAIQFAEAAKTLGSETGSPQKPSSVSAIYWRKPGSPLDSPDSFELQDQAKTEPRLSEIAVLGLTSISQFRIYGAAILSR